MNSKYPFSRRSWRSGRRFHRDLFRITLHRCQIAWISALSGKNCRHSTKLVCNCCCFRRKDCGLMYRNISVVWLSLTALPRFLSSSLGRKLLDCFVINKNLGIYRKSSKALALFSPYRVRTERESCITKMASIYLHNNIFIKEYSVPILMQLFTSSVLTL